jgi:predicted AlkP superfamily pyrophosphatase or phosphodiesterase
MKSTPAPLVVINIVGLTPGLLGEHTPNLNALINDGFMATLDGVFPAVTCTAQTTMLTGRLPSEHGIVANGWYFRDLAEVWLWRQSSHLVQRERVWDMARRSLPDFSCAQLFWWYNMYAGVDYSVTPRPIYPADGRKIPALYSSPDRLQAELEAELGKFPMFNFWGPNADIRSSRWIAACAKQVFTAHRPTLQLVYLPHLDYCLQRLGPNDPAIWHEVRSIDTVAGELIDCVRAGGAEVMVVSEYGIEPVTGHIHINRILREHGYIAVRETLGWELLDFGASRAFAMADHQAAHVYVRDPADMTAVIRLLSQIPGIAAVIQGEMKRSWGIDHERAGEIVLEASSGYWFTYYYWLDDNRAPDFAKTVDIHRKPGYDPVELFLDPGLCCPRLKVSLKLLRKALGFRYLMDVIPMDAGLVRGTHGRREVSRDHGPLLIATRKKLAGDHYPMQDVANIILDHWGLGS